MEKKKWFKKYVGCSFFLMGQERIFTGTCLNPDTKSGKPLQYVFEPNNVILDYREARAVMGAMIDKYSK